jgi:thymidylate synthase (FAD)
MSDYQLTADGCVEAYEAALEGGLAPELARMILPANLYTEWHWTGSLLGWSRVWGLRVKPDAQQETRDVVAMIGETMQELFPVAWNVLTERQQEG